MSGCHVLSTKSSISRTAVSLASISLGPSTLSVTFLVTQVPFTPALASSRPQCPYSGPGGVCGIRRSSPDRRWLTLSACSPLLSATATWLHSCLKDLGEILLWLVERSLLEEINMGKIGRLIAVLSQGPEKEGIWWGGTLCLWKCRMPSETEPRTLYQGSLQV